MIAPNVFCGLADRSIGCGLLLDMVPAPNGSKGSAWLLPEGWTKQRLTPPGLGFYLQGYLCPECTAKVPKP